MHFTGGEEEKKIGAEKGRLTGKGYRICQGGGVSRGRWPEEHAGEKRRGEEKEEKGAHLLVVIEGRSGLMPGRGPPWQERGEREGND